MADVIDDLRVQIDASTANADAKIDRFIQKMTNLQSAMSGIEMSGASNVASGINQISSAVQNFTERTKTADFTRVTTGLNKLGNVNVQGVSDAARAMSTLAANMSSLGTINYDVQGIINLANSIAKLGSKTVTQASQNIPLLRDSLQSFIATMNGLNSVTFDSSGLNSLVSAITKLGGKSASNAIPNIQSLGTALRGLMTTLSGAPTVSQNLIQMTNALANLAANGSRVSSANRSISSSLNAYSYSAGRATKSTKGLVSQIGMFYAKCFLLIRGVKALWKATKSSMDYIETLNYFDSAWGQVANNAAGEWKKAGYNSAEEYAKSFQQRASELTSKMSGFKPDANGNLTSTGVQSLGLNPETTMNYQATFGQMASSMGVASETALQLSNALTMIGADLASVKNLDYDQVWNDMASGMVGMSRTLDKYGVNIRNVNMQEKLYELGIKKKINTLNQNDKALLRTIILLDSTKYAWGDLARTITQPANQLRLLSANFANLARTIGNILLPIVSKVLPYINALIIAVQKLFSWLGGLLGIKMSGFSSSIGSAAVEMGDAEDSSGGVADNMGDAADSAKKMAANLQSFDKLNVITSQDSSSGGGSGSGGLGGLLDEAFLDAFSEYQKAWDAAFAKMENTAQEFADKIVDAFQRVYEAAEPTRFALRRLWDEGLARLGEFSWTALKDFWNEFLVPLGMWTLGTGLPMLIDNINAFLMKIDFPAINDALKNFWQALEPFAEKVGEGLIRFFGDLLSVGASFINNTVPNGLNAVADALKKIDPKTAESIGYALGVVATAIMGFKTVKTIAKNIGTLTENFNKFFKVAGLAKYSMIAIGIAAVVVALDEFGYIKVDWNTLSSAFQKLATALSKFAVGIGKGLISFIDGLLNVLSPTLEALINGTAKALDGIGTVLNAIPESAISGLTQVLLSLFVAFKTYEAVVKIGGLITAFANNISLFASVLPGIFNSGPILQNLALALGPTALGGIAFTAIAAGLILIATRISKLTDEAAKNSAIGQFATAIGELADEVDKGNQKIGASVNNTRKTVEDAGFAEAQVARDLAAEYEILSQKADLSANDKTRLGQISQELIGIIPDLNKYINEENGYLDIQAETLDALISKQELYAQKQASQENLVQAYKDQYEAQMNVRDAQEKYNKAFDDYLKDAKLAPDIIKQVSDGTFDMAQAWDVWENSGVNKFEKIYGVDSMGALKKAVKSLNEEMTDWNSTLEEAHEVEGKAAESLEFIREKSYEAEIGIRNYDNAILESARSTEEYKQKISDLSTAFSNLEISISDELLEGLALDNFDPTMLNDFFDSLANGVQASGSELKSVFSSLGLSLPDELTKAMSKKEPDVQAETTRILLGIQSGVQANKSQLSTLFSNLGLELPDILVSNLASKEVEVQTSAVNLLAKIENGYSLTDGNLKKLFSGLGLELPQELITSLASKDSDVQTQAIQLLGQISTASETEKPKLIDELNNLGTSIADDGVIKALDDKKGDVTNTTNTFLGEGIKNPLEAAKDTIKDLGWGVGENTVKGFNSGVEDNQDSTQGVISSWVSKITGWFTNALGIHSPSWVFGGYGVNTVLGYDGGVEDNIDSSVKTVKSWSEKIADAFAVPQFSLPDLIGNYSVNREILDMVDTTASVSFDNSQYSLTAGISHELGNALSNLIDYDKLGEKVYEAQTKAMSENPVTIGDKDIFDSTRRAQADYYRQTSRVGLAGI